MDSPVRGSARKRKSEHIGQLENDYALTVLGSREITKMGLKGIKWLLLAALEEY